MYFKPEDNTFTDITILKKGVYNILKNKSLGRVRAYIRAVVWSDLTKNTINEEGYDEFTPIKLSEDDKINLMNVVNILSKLGFSHTISCLKDEAGYENANELVFDAEQIIRSREIEAKNKELAESKKYQNEENIYGFIDKEEEEIKLQPSERHLEKISVEMPIESENNIKQEDDEEGKNQQNNEEEFDFDQKEENDDNIELEKTEGDDANSPEDSIDKEALGDIDMEPVNYTTNNHNKNDILVDKKQAEISQIKSVGSSLSENYDSKDENKDEARKPEFDDKIEIIDDGDLEDLDFDINFGEVSAEVSPTKSVNQNEPVLNVDNNNNDLFEGINQVPIIEANDSIGNIEDIPAANDYNQNIESIDDIDDIDGIGDIENMDNINDDRNNNKDIQNTEKEEASEAGSIGKANDLYTDFDEYEVEKDEKEQNAEEEINQEAENKSDDKEKDMYNDIDFDNFGVNSKDNDDNIFGSISNLASDNHELSQRAKSASGQSAGMQIDDYENIDGIDDLSIEDIIKDIDNDKTTNIKNQPSVSSTNSSEPSNSKNLMKEEGNNKNSDKLDDYFKLNNKQSENDEGFGEHNFSEDIDFDGLGLNDIGLMDNDFLNNDNAYDNMYKNEKKNNKIDYDNIDANLDMNFETFEDVEAIHEKAKSNASKKIGASLEDLDNMEGLDKMDFDNIDINEDFF